MLENGIRKAAPRIVLRRTKGTASLAGAPLGALTFEREPSDRNEDHWTCLELPDPRCHRRLAQTLWGLRASNIDAAMAHRPWKVGGGQSVQADVTEKFFTRVDVTAEFPFLVTKLSPHYDRQV